MNPAFTPVGNSQLVSATTSGSAAITLSNGVNAVRIRASALALVAFGNDSSIVASCPTTGVPANGVSLATGSEVFGVGPGVNLSFMTSSAVASLLVVTPGVQKNAFTPMGNSQIVMVTTSASAALQLAGNTAGVRIRNASPGNPVYVAFGTSSVVATNETTGAPANGIMVSLSSFEKFNVPPNCWVSFISSAVGPSAVHITQGFGK